MCLPLPSSLGCHGYTVVMTREGGHVISPRDTPRTWHSPRHHGIARAAQCCRSTPKHGNVYCSCVRVCRGQGSRNGEGEFAYFISRIHTHYSLPAIIGRDRDQEGQIERSGSERIPLPHNLLSCPTNSMVYP